MPFKSEIMGSCPIGYQEGIVVFPTRLRFEGGDFMLSVRSVK